MRLENIKAWGAQVGASAGNAASCASASTPASTPQKMKAQAVAVTKMERAPTVRVMGMGASSFRVRTARRCG